MRAIINDLRPAALDDLGIEPALRTLAEGVARSAGLAAEITIDLAGRRLSSDVEDAGFGLIGMRERAALAAGELDVASLEAGGTHVALIVPVG